MWAITFYSYAFAAYFEMEAIIPFVIRTIFSILLLLILFQKRTIHKLQKHEKIIRNYILILIIYQILQPFFNGNFSSLLVIPKFLFLFTLSYLMIRDKSVDKKFKINTILSIITLIFYLEFILYFIAFIKNPTFNYRELRYSVLLGNPNEDGGLLTTFLPIILFLNLNKKIRLFSFLSIYFLVMYFMNGTRTSLIFSLIITFFFILMYFKKRYIYIISISLLAFIYQNGIISFVKNSIGEDSALDINNLEYVIQGKYKGNFAGRIGGIWAPAFFYVSATSPIIGLGNSSWNDVVISAELSFRNSKTVGRSPHNLFLVCFVDWGYFGLLLILFIIFFSIKNLVMTKERYSLSLSIILAWFGFIGWAFMANANSLNGWLVFILLITISAIIKTNENLNNNA